MLLHELALLPLRLREAGRSKGFVLVVPDVTPLGLEVKVGIPKCRGIGFSSGCECTGVDVKRGGGGGEFFPLDVGEGCCGEPPLIALRNLFSALRQTVGRSCRNFLAAWE